MKSKIAAFIPDCHVPFEDPRAYDLMLQVLKHIQKTQGLDCICLLGDFLDMYGLSFYDKDPSLGDIADLYDREIMAGNIRLDQLDELAPGIPKIYLEGNHEYRLIKYINKFASALRNRIDIPTELNLKTRPKWTWIPYSHMQAVQILDSPLWARHEPFGSANPTTQAQKAGDSFIYGHTHQIGEGHYITKLSGRDVTAINSGCLIDINAKVFNYVRDRPSWKHAFTIAWCESNDFYHQIVRINPDYTCMFDSRIFKA